MPESHSGDFPDPPWLPLNEFSVSIKTALLAAFLLCNYNSDTYEFTEEEWASFFANHQHQGESEDKLSINHDTDERT